jgi:hypothetical protein
MQKKINSISIILMYTLPLSMGAFCFLKPLENLRAAITPMAAVLAITAAYQLFLHRRAHSQNSRDY